MQIVWNGLNIVNMNVAHKKGGLYLKPTEDSTIKMYNEYEMYDLVMTLVVC